jgi:hypothetical protein
MGPVEQQIQQIRNKEKEKTEPDWSESKEDILESAQRTLETGK